MGESDLYCAFCSGPMLKSRIEFTKRRTSTPGRKADYAEASIAESARTDTDNHDDEESIESTEDEDDYSDSEDDRTSGYNPDVLSLESTEWIGVCRCLALNMDQFEIDGAGKVFLSGYGSPDGLGYFMVHQRGVGKVSGKHGFFSQLTSQIRMTLEPLSIHATTLSILGKQLHFHSTTRAWRSLRAALD